MSGHRVIPQPHHPGRWLVVDADGKSDGWSYPTREEALGLPRDLSEADVKAFFSLPDDDDSMHTQRSA